LLMERVSVDSLQDWIRVKNNYSSAATNAIISAIDNHDLHDEREAILAHFSHVSFSFPPSNPLLIPPSSWILPLPLRKPT